MSKGQTKKTREAAGNRRKLTRAEKKQIAAVIRQAKGDGKAHTAQQTIPYLAMYPDGICKVAQRKYSKSIAFEDINYQLAQADDKTAIFENWCDFLNYFDASVNVQLSFINQGSQQEQAARAIHIPPQNDDFNSIRTEYEEYGRDAAINDEGRFTEQGYIYNNRNTFTEWYDGRDVPEEYRVTPQPPVQEKEQADLDASAAIPPATEQPPVLPIILSSEKPADKMKEITDRLEQGILGLYESDRYADYLRTIKSVVPSAELLLRPPLTASNTARTAGSVLPADRQRSA